MVGSAVSDLAGRVLAGRYLLHSPIGTGASGRVYVAEDTRLRRRVAVKVLHAALAQDSAFLRRFRAEAQLAASLHHPHIVTVHDWGEDDLPFMVLELLVGGSLRGLLDQGRRLSTAQAARIGRDVASALEYAHARGVLHRDIKPANLLFDEHGIVRVADFGLARALAEASWTEPAGAVFGTARYASPEQARGVQLDARSDLYSLALVLVEAVTGRLPFTSDTTLGMLTARTQRPLRAPHEMGPLAPVIDRVGAVNPDDRYPDAATMRAALADAGELLPPPAPLPVAGMVDGTDPHPTRAVAPPSTRLFDQDAVEVTAPVTREPVAEPERAVRRQRRLVPFVVALVLVASVAFASAALARVRSGSPVAVPSLVGLTKQQALDAAERAGVRVTFGDPRAAPDPLDTVIDQSPDGGVFAADRAVRLWLSAGPAPVTVPDVTGKAWTEARQLLDAAGLLYDADPPKRYDDRAPAGTVLSVSRAGEEVAPDTKVDVLLSAGHAPVAVPDVSDESYDDAANALERLGFRVKRADKDEFSSDIDKGLVTRTDPAAGKQAPFGSTITVFVSKGPDLVVVPNLTNLSFEEASAALDRQGLSLAVKGSYKRNEVVVDQDPSPGERIERGSTVTVTFGRAGFLD